MKHKRLSALLAAGIMLSALPALPNGTPLRPAIIANAADSGTCGESLTWTLEDGVLTISGEGETEDYAYQDTPWSDYKESIKSIVIDEGVTQLNDCVFQDCAAVTVASLPDSLYWIGKKAFAGCTALTEITLPPKTSLIGGEAFMDCTSLKSITFSNKQLSNAIGSYAFQNCTALTGFEYPDNQFGALKISSEFTGCTNLTDITIPKGIRSISDKAFRDCKNLTIHGYTGSYAEEYAAEHNIPFEAVDANLSGSFGDGFTWSLDEERTLTITGTGDMPVMKWAEYPWHESVSSIKRIVISDGVTSVSSDAFSACSAVESVSLPDSLTVIGDNAFQFCSELKEVRIPDSVTKIDWNAFAGCSELTEIVIPDSVTELGSAAFSGCSSLTTANLPKDLDGVKGSIFADCPITEITIPEHAQYIGSDAFSGCKLTSISIPDKVNSIGSSAFMGCPLTEVTIPVNVENIDNDAFRCSLLTDTTIENPDCVLFDDVGTIYISATIHGYAGSTAEAYANKYNRKFEEIVPSASVSGDYNGDCEVTVADAVLLARFISEDTALTGGQVSAILDAEPDYDSDGLVTILDVAALLKKLGEE